MITDPIEVISKYLIDLSNRVTISVKLNKGLRLRFDVGELQGS